MEIDRRKTYRVPFSPKEGSRVTFSPIGFTGRIKPPQTGLIFNMSEGGMSALIHMKVGKGKKFWIDIDFPGLLQKCRVLGQAVWVEDDPSGTNIGISFIDTPPTVLDAIRKVAYDYRVCEAGMAFAMANVCKRNCSYWDFCQKPIKLKI
ncbi:MAG: PilZ domain-containing protein [Elusimicrobia bacterium]|nr:PilZ domain-containing protein [Elusimicrobiota bacterium]